MKKGLATKPVATLTAICALIALVSAFSDRLLLLYLSLRFKTDINNLNVNIKEASSIGIIGGADGPTSIFLSGKPDTLWITFVSAALAILGIIYLCIAKRAKRKS